MYKRVNSAKAEAAPPADCFAAQTYDINYAQKNGINTKALLEALARHERLSREIDERNGVKSEKEKE